MKHLFCVLAGLLIFQAAGLQAQDTLYKGDPLQHKLRKFMPEAFEQQSSETTVNTASPHTEAAAKKPENSERIYQVPFAAQGNSIELTIANTTGQDIKDVIMKADGLPDWLEMEPEQRVAELPAGKEHIIRYIFHLKEEAPVGEQLDLEFSAAAANGFYWSKQIRLKIAPPSEFALDQNYPNPFNPTTTISYRLPAQMNVKVTVFDVLGRKVATLADGLQEAGTQTLSWDASRMASGLYFYRVVAEGEGGKRLVQNKKMMLIK